jgi:hypothetical protein
MMRRRSNYNSCSNSRISVQRFEMLVIALIALLCYTSPYHGGGGVAAQQPSSCSTQALEDYVSCVRSNPCACSHCDPDPSDSYPVIVVDAPQDCQDVSRIFCPMIRCCSVCEPVFEHYHKCLGNIIAETFLGLNHGCPLFYCPLASFPYMDTIRTPESSCGGGGGGDDDGDGDGEIQANSEGPPCMSAVSEYESCFSSQCGDCPNVADDWRTQLIAGLGTSDRQSEESPPWTCSFFKTSYFCPLQDCCPSCTAKLRKVGQCMQSNNLLIKSQCLAQDCPESSSTTTTTTTTTEGKVADSEPQSQQVEPELGPSIVAAVESTTSSGDYTYSSRVFNGVTLLVTAVLVFGS